MSGDHFSPCDVKTISDEYITCTSNLSDGTYSIELSYIDQYSVEYTERCSSSKCTILVQSTNEPDPDSYGTNRVFTIF